jgi:hypothetical protein
MVPWDHQGGASREDVVAEFILMVNPISYYECCYAKLQLMLGSEVCPKYLMGLA